MKQPEDNKTMDMYGEVQSKPQTTPHTYIFYVVLDDGTNIEWRGLTETNARSMWRITNKRTPDNVRTYGWEEVK